VRPSRGLQKRTGVKAERAAKRGTPDRPFQVNAPVRDATSGKDLTEAQIFEGRVVLALFFIFTVCLVEGLVVGASVRTSPRLILCIH
jgi:hypothetical protein